MTDASGNILFYLQQASAKMEKLIQFSASRIETIDTSFKRYLWDSIKWDNRLIAITGARGVGKTTLLLQYIKENLNDLKMYLERYIGEIVILCQKNRVKNLYVFGSVLTDRFNDKSDIDLIVDIDSNDPLDYADNYFNLKFALEALLNRQIDLLENKSIKNPYLRENIDNSKTLLYAS